MEKVGIDLVGIFGYLVKVSVVYVKDNKIM